MWKTFAFFLGFPPYLGINVESFVYKWITWVGNVDKLVHKWKSRVIYVEKHYFPVENMAYWRG